MKDLAQTPFVGATRSQACAKTVEVICHHLRQLSPLQNGRLLDVGCGDGTFTMALSHGFSAVIGIDVQACNIEAFKSNPFRPRHVTPLLMSAEALEFPDNYFATLISIETIEHIPNLEKAISEMARVLEVGGELLVTCPNRWFPFENHGIRMGSRVIGRRIPLLPYLPALHRRLALARVFTVRALDRYFGPLSLRRTGLRYAWPTFEHGGNPLQTYLRFLFPVMRRCEESIFSCFGTSIVARYVKTRA